MTLSWARERPESHLEWASTWLQVYWWPSHFGPPKKSEIYKNRTTAVNPMLGLSLRGTGLCFAASVTRRKLIWARWDGVRGNLVHSFFSLSLVYLLVTRFLSHIWTPGSQELCANNTFKGASMIMIITTLMICDILLWCVYKTRSPPPSFTDGIIFFQALFLPVWLWSLWCRNRIITDNDIVCMQYQR